jgi:hypothetical protein
MRFAQEWLIIIRGGYDSWKLRDKGQGALPILLTIMPGETRARRRNLRVCVIIGEEKNATGFFLETSSDFQRGS